MPADDSQPITERREEPRDEREPIVFRPLAIIRAGGILIGLVVALPSIVGILAWQADAGAEPAAPTSWILPIFLATLGLYFAWRSWAFSAEVDNREFRYHGILYSQTFPLESIRGIEEVYYQRRSYLVVADLAGNTVANAESLRLLHDYEQLSPLLDTRAGRPAAKP